MREVMEVNDADCSGIAHRLIRGLWLESRPRDLMAVLNFRSRSRLVNEFNRALRHSLPYVGGRESCVSCANPNVGMRSTFQLSLRQGIAGTRQSWLRLSGQRPEEFRWILPGMLNAWLCDFVPPSGEGTGFPLGRKHWCLSDAGREARVTQPPVLSNFSRS